MRGCKRKDGSGVGGRERIKLAVMRVWLDWDQGSAADVNKRSELQAYLPS